MRMVSPPHPWSPQTLVMMLHLFVLFSKPITIYATTFTNKLDQTLVAQEPDTEIKCGTCPCVNPCDQLPPPPPPPPPPPSPPPPPPKNAYCSPCNLPTILPPPPPRFIYVTDVPGNLYSTTDSDEWTFYSSARLNDVPWLMLFVGYGVLVLLAIL